MVPLYDGEENWVFRMEYGDKTEGGFTSGAEKEENTVAITEKIEGETGRSRSPLILYVLETEEEREEVTETRQESLRREMPGPRSFMMKFLFPARWGRPPERTTWRRAT